MKCWNCRNGVSFGEEPCPRCGVSLRPQRVNRVVAVVAIVVLVVFAAVFAL